MTAAKFFLLHNEYQNSVKIFQNINIWRYGTRSILPFWKEKQLLRNWAGISEDADGDGNWDNEDDGDGLLEDDEDDGYDFDINGIAIKYGAGNNEIDNEDSNGDGQLKWDENSGMQVLA
ncbi:MAG: hypothetical protein MZV65_45075 [Chromatiales bacterium]|nr:hypothetical protein [Chromatiales bacterium]